MMVQIQELLPTLKFKNINTSPKLRIYLMNFSSFKIKKLHLLILLITSLINAQSLDLQSFKGNPFKLSGGINVGSTFYKSERNSRQPFVYNLSGNLNFSFYNFSLPISYTYTNLGGNLNYSIPFSFNRLSINPKYKWISAYAGDITLNFSPYTYAGHQFTGGAVELTPNAKIKIAALGGKFLKATEDDGNPNSLPAYERWGYGLKVDYGFSKYKVGINTFFAKDLENSVNYISPTRNITPQKNLAIGVVAEGQINKEVKVYVDFTNSTLVTDTRADGTFNKGFASTFINPNSSSRSFNALKTGFDVKIQKSTLGISYEKVDPNYKTLGAFFFSNDLENITANISRPFWKDKIAMTLNVGFQRDNLNNEKDQTNTRVVSTLNASIKLSDKLNLTANFSNQNAVTNVNPDQFVEINQQNPELQSVQQLNYRQLSRSASFNSSYTFKKSTKSQKTINGNYSYNQVANEQGGLIRVGQLSDFHNLNLTYGHQLLKSKWGFNASTNMTVNKVGTTNSVTVGPVLSASKKFLKDKLTSSFGTAINTTTGNGKSSFNFNIRANAAYKYLDNHNFNMSLTNLISQSKTLNNATSLSELTINFNYTYNINTFAKKKKDEKKLTEEDLKKPTIEVKLDKKAKDLNIAEIKNEIVQKFEKNKVTNLPLYNQKVVNQKDSLFKTIEKFEAEQLESDRDKIATSISKQLVEFEKSINYYTTFNDKYTTLYDKAVNDLIEKTKNRQLFGKKYFERKYNFPVEEDKTIGTDYIEKIIAHIKANKIEINTKDAIDLGQVKMLLELQDYAKNKTSDNKIYEEVKADLKENYFAQFEKRTDINKKDEEIIVVILERYNLDFFNQFGELLKSNKRSIKK